MITKLKISNFKSHLDTELKINALTILSGINSSGKSSVLQTFLLLRQSYNKGRLNAGLDLNEPLCNIGFGNDALSRSPNRDSDSIIFAIDTDNHNNCSWAFDTKNRYKDTFLPLCRETKKIMDNNIFQQPLFIINKFQYISSARWAGSNSYKMDTYAVETEKQISLNYGQGELIAHFLEYYGQNKNFEIKLKKLLHPNSSSEKLLEQVIEWEREISPRVTILPIKKDDKVTIKYGYKGIGSTRPLEDLSANNIGFGISYSLAVVVAILAAEEGDLLLLENPEAHLHPQGQAKLAELICLAAQNGVQIIVETHSDHIINGILVQCKEFEEKQKGISKDNVSIYYFDMDGEKHCSKAEKINIETGGRVRYTPKGFFDQFTIDRKRLMGF